MASYLASLVDKLRELQSRRSLSNKDIEEMVELEMLIEDEGGEVPKMAPRPAKRKLVDRTIPLPELPPLKQFTEGFVAYDSKTHDWYEMQGCTLKPYGVLRPKKSTMEAMESTLDRVFKAFSDANSLTLGEQNFIKSILFTGVGPLPKELDMFRGICITFGPVRPSTYYSLFKKFEWYDCGVPVVVYCDGYAGIDEMPRVIADDLSYINYKGEVVTLSGKGTNLLSNAREKIDGRLVCHIEVVSPTGIVSNYNLDGVIKPSELTGYGYTEYVAGIHFHVSGSIESTHRTYQNFDSFTEVAEGLVVNVNGVSYKLKNVNTYEVSLDSKGMAYDAKNFFVGPVVNPHKLKLVAGRIYECRDGIKNHELLNPRITRDGAHTLSHINAIKNCPVLSDYKTVCVGLPIYVSAPPTVISGLPLKQITTLTTVIDQKKRLLSLKSFVEIVKKLVEKGSTTVALIIAALTPYDIVLPVPKMLHLLMFAECTYRSNFVRKHEGPALLVYNEEAKLRSEDEIVVAVSNRGRVPMFRSLLVYNTFLPRAKPVTVAFVFRAKEKIYFTKPHNYGYYDFAAGGMVAWGESCDQAVVRETLEELGEVIKFQTGTLLHWRGTAINYKKTIDDGIEFWSEFHKYTLDIDTEYKFEPQENRSGRWALPQGIPMRHDYALAKAKYFDIG
jgi:8-oxo-dGTP pyrophosphatase MutT (NUDIX family)